jgi:hypothetical protein
MVSVSVCTLAQGRDEHLRNLVLGLAQSRHPIDELVVTVLQDAPFVLPDTPFAIRQILMPEAGMHLSRARNRSAREAGGDLLVFLDVDCIPAPGLVGDYVKAAKGASGILMGEVGYLPKGATGLGIDFARFEALAVRHSDRPGPPEHAIAPCRDYRCFWSLNFALTAADFARSGGFDESFAGYGGEDTDFGRTCVEQGIALSWIRGGKAYHQYHPHHMPPVHHLDSVLANAERFRAKWGEPTMQHWLRAFRLMGLADQDNGVWRKLRQPDEAALGLTRQQEDAPYASSAKVLEQLERRAAAPAMEVAN